MRTVKPIEPIRAARAIKSITLRRVPSFRQLRLWFVFARQKAKDRFKDRAARRAASGQAAVAPAEALAELEGEEQTRIAADHGHIDKRV
jgi:hypothetical protein